MQNDEKASRWNSFYRTASVVFNTDRTLSLDHWAPTAEILWNTLQAALFSVFSLNSSREVHVSMKTHILHIYPITCSNKNNNLLLLDGKTQLTLPTTTQLSKVVNRYTWQFPALFPIQVLVISSKICWLLKLKFSSEFSKSGSFCWGFVVWVFFLIENGIT